VEIGRPWQAEGHVEEVNHPNTSLLGEVEMRVEEANLYVLGVRRTSFLEVAIDVVVVKVIEIHWYTSFSSLVEIWNH